MKRKNIRSFSRRVFIGTSAADAAGIAFYLPSAHVQTQRKTKRSPLVLFEVGLIQSFLLKSDTVPVQFAPLVILPVTLAVR